MENRLIQALTNLLKRLLPQWKNSSSAIEPSPHVEPDEEIATFIRYEGHLNKGTTRIRPEALLPRWINGRFETSVCRSSGTTHAAIWSIAQKHFERPPTLITKAIGFGRADKIYEAELLFDADGKPYSRHANIVGWNAGPLEKHAGKLQAQKIAAYFTYEQDIRGNS